MMWVLAVCLLAAAAADEAAPRKQLVELEQSYGLGGAWVPRCSVELTMVEGDETRKWRATARSAGSFTAEEVAPAEAALRGDSYFRVRARTPEGTAVVGATRMCALAAAGWKHSIVFGLSPEGSLVSVHVRPSVPEGFAGCDGAAGSALPAAGSPWAALFGVAPAEEAFGAPPAPLGAKFTAPYPGQAPVSESEALAAAAGHAPASPEEKAELAAKLAAAQKREAEEREANKGFFERYQSFLLPLGIVFAIQSLFGKPEPEAKPTKPGAAGGGAAGGAAGPARVVPAAKPARLAAAAAEAK